MYFALPQSPSGTVTKKALYTPSREDGIATVGDTIEYIVVASNDGNVELFSVNLTDQMFKNDTGVAFAGRIHKNHKNNVKHQDAIPSCDIAIAVIVCRKL